MATERERESPEHLQTLKSSTPEMFFFMLWHWQTFHDYHQKSQTEAYFMLVAVGNTRRVRCQQGTPLT
jgi:hypothetical protein